MSKTKKFVVAAAVALALAVTASAFAATWSFGATISAGTSDTQDTMTLQTALNALGVASPALTVDGAFGAKTTAALEAFQAAHGLTVDGVAGPHTEAAIVAAGAAMGTSMAPTQGSCPSGYVSITPVAPTFSSCAPAAPVQGSCPAGYVSVTPVAPTFASCAVGTGASNNSGVGVLTNVNQISGYSGLTLNAGDSNDKVIGAQFTATGGDMKVDRLVVDFQRGGSNPTTGYYQLSQYISGITIWNAAGTQLASVPVSEASDITSVPSGQTDIFQFNVAGLNYVVPAGTTGQLYVAVNVNPTIDSSNASGLSWTATIPASGIGAIDSTGVLDSYPAGTNLGASTFTVDNLSTSGNVQLRASIDANNPAAHGVQVNSISGNTNGVQLLSFDVYAKPGSSILVRKFPVSLSASMAVSTSSVADMVQSLTLTNTSVAGSQPYTANIPSTCGTAGAGNGDTTCTVLFGSDSGVLGWTIPAGATQVWTVSANIAPTNAYFQEGDTLTASVPTLYGSTVDAQDSIGNPLNTQSALTGGAQGNAVGFYVNGITVSDAGNDSAVIAGSLNSASAQTGTFTLNFNVTALNSSLYIPNTVSFATPASGGKVYLELTDASVNHGFLQTASGSINATNGTLGADTSSDFYVGAGSSREFTVVVSYTNDPSNGGYASGDQFRLSLGGVNYSTTSGSGYNDYTLNVTNIRTGTLALTHN